MKVLPSPALTPARQDAVRALTTANQAFIAKSVLRRRRELRACGRSIECHSAAARRPSQT